MMQDNSIFSYHMLQDSIRFNLGFSCLRIYYRQLPRTISGFLEEHFGDVGPIIKEWQSKSFQLQNYGNHLCTIVMFPTSLINLGKVKALELCKK